MKELLSSEMSAGRELITLSGRGRAGEGCNNTGERDLLTRTNASSGSMALDMPKNFASSRTPDVKDRDRDRHK